MGQALFHLLHDDKDTDDQLKGLSGLRYDKRVGPHDPCCHRSIPSAFTRALRAPQPGPFAEGPGG